MGLINLYDTISNEKKVIQGNGILKELLPNYNLDNCEIIKAGQKLTKDYEVKQDDVLLLRVLPKGMSALLITTLVVSGVALLAGATLGAVMLVKQKKNKEEMEKAQRDAANLAQTVDTKPYLKGAKNKNALGSLMPYQVGEIYNTPMTLTDGFIEIGGTNGKDQYFNFNFNLGYGDLVVKKILIGDEVILNNASGIAEGEHDFNSTSPYYDAENYVELRQAGNDFTQNTKFNKKVVLTQDGAELKHDYGDEAGTEIIRQIADNTKTLEVCITFNGLRQYDESLSTWVARTATVRPYWSNDGGTTWNEFYFSGMNDNTIEINSKETIRFVATKTFAPADVLELDENNELVAKEILLKVVKTTPKLESNSNEDCYLQYYQSFCYDPKTSDLTQLTDCKVIEDFFKSKLTRLAVHVKATENTTDTLDEFHVIASAMAPIWNGTSWGEKAATNNPAAIIYEILTNDKHKPSQMTTDDFDADDLGALYEYCEEMGYTSNAIITSQIKKLDIIDNILQTVNAVMYRQDGLLRFAIDTLEENPVALINAENIKNITYTKELKRKPNGIKVTYTNEKTWQIDTFYLVIDPVTKALRDYRTDDDTLTELTLDYVTNYNHASKIALRNLKELILQSRVITAGVGNVGDRYPLFSTVLLQYKEFRQGLGSGTIHRILYDTNGDIAGLEISDLMKFNNSTSAHYGVVIYAVSELGSQLYYKTIKFTKEKAILNTTNGLLNTIGGLLGVIKPGTTATRTIYFDEPIEVTAEAILPQLLNSISVGILDNNGEFTKVTHTMKITNIEPDGNGSFTLTLKDYNPNIYDVGAIPSYKSNITPAARVAKAIPSNPNTNSDILTNDAKAKIYEETGLSRLDSVDITEVNEDTGEVTIKADLIKGAQGVFDEITSNNSTFVDCTVTGRFECTKGFIAKNELSIAVTQDTEELFHNINSIIDEELEINKILTMACFGYAAIITADEPMTIYPSLLKYRRVMDTVFVGVNEEIALLGLVRNEMTGAITYRVYYFTKKNYQSENPTYKLEYSTGYTPPSDLFPRTTVSNFTWYGQLYI